MRSIFNIRHLSFFYSIINLLKPSLVLLSLKCFADLPDFHADNTIQYTIPASLFITPYHPDIVIYNPQSSSIALLELTCPLDSSHHIQSARSKTDYLQLLAEFDCLSIANFYETIEITVQGH